MSKQKPKKQPVQPVSPWKEPFNWIITGIIVLGVLAVTIIALYNRGIPQRYTTAVTVGSEKISVGEYNFYRNSYYNNFLQTNGSFLSYMGLDTSRPLNEQSYSADQTWADFFEEQTMTYLQRETAFAAEAEKNGVTLTDENKQAINTFLDDVRTSAKNDKSASLGAYIESNFGQGVTLNTIQKIFERSYLAQAYTEQKSNEKSYTDADFDAYYEQHADQIDLASYRDFHFYVPPAEEPSGDEINLVEEGAAEEAAAEEAAAEEAAAAAMEDARLKAETMLSAITNEASFNTLAYENANEASKAGYEENPDASLQADKAKSDISNAAVGDWVFDPARKPGDKTTMEGDSGYYVLYFVNRVREEYPCVTVRHILIQPTSSEDTEIPTEEQMAEALAKAEAIYDEWKAGDQTEEAFIALVEQYSQDPGSNETGGLYEDIYKGQMVAPFEDWSFDPARKPGDTGIVETEYGFHIMYFSGTGEIRWKAKAKTQLESEAYQALLDATLEQYPLTENSSGMKLVSAD
jgi:parvulin-like peptidyl-prolyl isomerase